MSVCSMRLFRCDESSSSLMTLEIGTVDVETNTTQWNCRRFFKHNGSLLALTREKTGSVLLKQKITEMSERLDMYCERPLWGVMTGISPANLFLSLPVTNWPHFNVLYRSIVLGLQFVSPSNLFLNLFTFLYLNSRLVCSSPQISLLITSNHHQLTVYLFIFSSTQQVELQCLENVSELIGRK